MITLIGVAHVFDINEQVENALFNIGPDLVCIELDRARYQALINKSLKKKGTPIIYRMLAAFQKEIAKKYNTKVGEEMLTAVATAKKIRADVAFIDASAAQVFHKIWTGMTFKERLKFITGAFGGLFIRKERVEKEIKNFEKNYDYYMDIFGDEFPTVKHVLIDERDVYMSNAIKKLSEKYNNIVAVVGDGHIIGMQKELKEFEVNIIRLNELKNMINTTVSYHYTVNNN